MGLKVDKSPDPDNLHPRVFKEVALEIIDPLMVIFQNPLDSGIKSSGTILEANDDLKIKAKGSAISSLASQRILG